MNDRLIDNFKLYFPFIAEQTVNTHEIPGSRLIAELSDGTRVLYNDQFQSLRTLPRDIAHQTEEESQHEFRKRLQELMDWKHMTQQMLSDATGISQTSISHYLNGKMMPSYQTVNKLARALGCSMDDFRDI